MARGPKNYNKDNTKIKVTSNNILVMLKNSLNIAMKINIPNDLRSAVDAFVVNLFQGADATSKAHFAKINLFTDFVKSTMTIKVFFKYLKVLRIKEVTLRLIVTNHRDEIFTVEQHIPINKMLGEEYLEEEEKKHIGEDNG